MIIPEILGNGDNETPISFGAGVNSTAMTIMLVNQGWHGDVVFADTGAEWPETYCFIDYFEQDWLRPRALGVTRLGPEYRKDKRARQVASLIEFCEHYAMLPLAAVRWCTTLFKVEPLQGYHGGEALIGFAADEAHRAKGRRAPLIEAGITRKGCIEIIRAEGLDVPQKSGCYICPFQRNDQWHELWHRHPDLIERAPKLEELADARRRLKGQTWGATLDPHGKISVHQRIYAYEHQIELPGIDMDDLLRFKPCVCGL